jgi:hypothetical protein
MFDARTSYHRVHYGVRDLVCQIRAIKSMLNSPSLYLLGFMAATTAIIAVTTAIFLCVYTV